MTNGTRPLEHILERRMDFPSLRRTLNGQPLAYLDGPAGTQIPQSVIEAMVGYYTTCNANTHGCFVTTKESDELLEQTRLTVATYLGAESNRTISFGANMTTLAFALSKAIGRTLKEGDEILITQLDHEANRGPWLTLRERGAIVNEVIIKKDGTLDDNDFRTKITSRTRLVALGMASNALGTVNNVALARELTSKVGALLMLDAVHYAPHFPIDVEALKPDFLLCSAYKFYGPHVGILYSRDGLLDQLETDRLRTQESLAPYRIETGTLNHAAIVGVKAAVEYIASFGTGSDLRSKIVSAMQLIAQYEHSVAEVLYEGLQRIEGVTIYGPSIDVPRRAPTISFTLKSKNPVEVCTRLGERGICTWDGHFYAIRPMEVLGLLERGGVTRVGISLYNTVEEIERLLEEVTSIAKGN
ncbi:MAG TPA: cysteine desulfurase-like protein [Bacteroidetes bacterium]|nr:cysteine desulfurase-like protein [Bacteroidota bacterium]